MIVAESEAVMVGVTAVLNAVAVNAVSVNAAAMNTVSGNAVSMNAVAVNAVAVNVAVNTGATQGVLLLLWVRIRGRKGLLIYFH